MFFKSDGKRLFESRHPDSFGDLSIVPMTRKYRNRLESKYLSFLYMLFCSTHCTVFQFSRNELEPLHLQLITCLSYVVRWWDGLILFSYASYFTVLGDVLQKTYALFSRCHPCLCLCCRSNYFFKICQLILRSTDAFADEEQSPTLFDPNCYLQIN